MKNSTNKEKDLLRKKMHELRKQFFANTKKFEEYSYKAQEHLLASDEFASSDFICAYAALHGEVLTNHFVTESFKHNKNVLFPRCHDEETGIMQYFLCKSCDDLELGRYNIQEPKSTCPVIQSNILNSHTTLILVPAITFDVFGYRLGYGLGYYDRFLEHTPQAITVGLTFSELLCPEIPRMSWDKAVCFIATEKGFTPSKK